MHFKILLRIKLDSRNSTIEFHAIDKRSFKLRLFTRKMSLQLDERLQHPFSMLVAGGTGAGKTAFTKHLLKEGNWLIHPTPQRIIWCYAKHQPNLLKELTEIVQAIQYVQGIPSEIDSLFDQNVNNLIILDSTMDEASQDKRISQLFTRWEAWQFIGYLPYTKCFSQKSERN